MSKTPWPTKAVMTQIYDQHFWGGHDHDFYSGEGSHLQTIVEPYVKSVSEFLQRHQNKLTVCDLGCGDFNIGKQLLPYTSYYYGIDIVDKLIERNKKQFDFENLEFHCLDSSQDDLPNADVAIIRQVFQHLSNAEIQRILDKLHSFQYLILTEHLPQGKFVPNIDIIASLGNRLKVKSGVDITESPFNFKSSTNQVLNEVFLEDGNGKIETRLFTLQESKSLLR